MLRISIPCAGAALAALLLGASASLAQPHSRGAPSVERARETGENMASVRFCVPANGAQVLGGYAAPTDLLDPLTGAICNPRQNGLRE